MKFFTAIILAMIGSVIAVPLQDRAIKVGALDTILATMSSTLAQDQAITNQAIAQMKSAAASEVVLAQKMAAILLQTGSDIQYSGSQIAATLQNAGTTLAAPNIAYLTQAIQQATAIAKSSMQAFQAQGMAAAAAFSASTGATIAAEILAAESALQPFLNPMIAYAMTVQSDGSAQAAASMAGLKSAADACVALAQSLNQVLGISTS